MEQIKNLEPNYPNIKISKKVISAYDLYKMLENEMFGLESELNKLLSSMHNYLKYNKPLLEKIFKTKKEDGIISTCNGITFENKEHKQIINLYLSSKPNQISVPELKIIYYPKKDKFEILGLPKRFVGYYYDYYYSKIDNQEDLECIEAHLEQIKEICSSTIYGKDQKYNELKFMRISRSIQIKNELFTITFNYHQEKRSLEPIIKINAFEDETNKSGLTKIDYTLLLEKLSGTNEDVLKTIPVRIPDLSYEVQSIINHQIYKSKEQTLETTRIKSLRKVKTKI